MHFLIPAKPSLIFCSVQIEELRDLLYEPASDADESDGDIGHSIDSSVAEPAHL